MGKSRRTRVTKASRFSDFYTPYYATDILIPFLKARGLSHIWECACGLGHIADVLKENRIDVYQSDVADLGEKNKEAKKKNFLHQHHLPKGKIQAIVTNPPFDLKDQFIEKCYTFNIPFALLMPLSALGGKERINLYIEHGIELLIPDKRVNFIYSEDKSDNWFHSAWFCYDILPERIMFTRMNTDDKNRHQYRLC